MDANELIQAVTEMEERARVVPETVQHVAELAAEYEGEVKAYLDRVEQKKSRVAALKAKVDAALDALQDKASSERPVLEGGMRQIETAVEQARDAVSESVGQLEDALDAAGTAASALKAALVDAAARTESAQSAASADLDGLSGQMTSSESGLDTSVGTAANTADGVEDAAEEARDTVVAALDALSQSMTEYAEQHVGSRLDRAASALESQLSAHRDHVEGVLDALEGGAKELGQSFEQEIEEKVTDAMSEAVTHAAESYLGLQNAHGTAQAACAGEREETGTAAADLQEWIEPMKGMVEQVKQAAARANTPWPA